ncbi:hypothetical protein [Sphingomonas sp. BE137]|uniref:hypothetical protein n=1 Tax=Sphingomonas sp. BE137 TaxID=2817844 RepID=UPI001AE9B355|nr:hypothetical protein [Sphingomonas sp. BE137]MDR6850394.1 hypothetical protein [Sphingomonas sp. BE137]
MKTIATLAIVVIVQSGHSPLPKPWPCKLRTPRAVVCAGGDPDVAIKMFDRFSANQPALQDEGTRRAIATYGCRILNQSAGTYEIYEHGRAQVATLDGYKTFVIVDVWPLYYATIDQRWLVGHCPAPESILRPPSSSNVTEFP